MHDHDDYQLRVLQIARESADLREAFFAESAAGIVTAAEKIASAMSWGGKLLLCGNGGSAADSQHIAAEFVGRFRRDRQPLPAIALTTDTSALTALSNDVGFDHVFELQVHALGGYGDVLIAISTSGNSPNVVRATRAAVDKGIYVIGLLGGDGGVLRKYCSQAMVVPHDFSARVQEIHIMVGHVLCELVEDMFLGGAADAGIR